MTKPGAIDDIAVGEENQGFLLETTNYSLSFGHVVRKIHNLLL
jgi:hypothetical protein